MLRTSCSGRLVINNFTKKPEGSHKVVHCLRTLPRNSEREPDGRASIPSRIRNVSYANVAASVSLNKDQSSSDRKSSPSRGLRVAELSLFCSLLVSKLDRTDKLRSLS